MDPERLARIEGDLVAWGLLERADGLQVTRRFRGALARAAMHLAEEEQAGRRPEGHPVARAVEVALADYPLPPEAALGEEHRLVLVAVEVAGLPESVRKLFES